MIDSHTHLHLCQEPLAQLVAAAADAGVNKMLTVGIDPVSCREALATAEDYPQIHASIGRHPSASHGFDDADLAELEALASHPKCVAIGETGLDLHRDPVPLADQERAFIAQIELAMATKKALVIHTRAAEERTMELLQRASAIEVVMHCFSMPDQLDECLARGYAISFAGNLTYPSAQPLQEAASRVPIERLLVETDAPFLTPQPVRKHRNQPAYVVHTASFLAHLRGESLAQLSGALERNASSIFGW